jgi:hypothetical protein
MNTSGSVRYTGNNAAYGLRNVNVSRGDVVAGTASLIIIMNVMSRASLAMTVYWLV